LLQIIIQIFPKKFDNKVDFIVYFSHFLNKVFLDNKNVLLIIDEAHRLSIELLEDIRLLSNIELPEKKLINIFLVGQNEINQTLASQECRALRQRIMLNYQINPLSEIETFMDKEITVLEIEKNTYLETLDFTKDTDSNWKKLMRENEKELVERKKKKKILNITTMFPAIFIDCF